MFDRTLAAACGAIAASLVVVACDRRADTGTPASTPDVPPPLVLSEPVTSLPFAAREPMLVQHPDGTLFLSGYGSPAPKLARSGDGGRTWTAVDVGDAANGAIGDSDVDLAIGPDGTLYFIAMSYDRQKYEGTQIAIGASGDSGRTWSWTTLSKTRNDDRPWVEVTPDGVAHAIWNDGSGVSYAVSRDHGQSWTEQPKIHPQGHSSHLAAGPSGEIAVRITPVSASMNVEHEGVELVAVSTDGGATWSKHPAPGHREYKFPYTDEEDPMPRWVEPIAWDASGALYYLWTDPDGLWLARSSDRGARWTSWQLARGGPLRYFPYLVARGRGELAATWHTGRGSDIRVHVARIDLPPGSASPRFVEAAPFASEAWQLRQPTTDEPRKRDTAGEYVPVIFLRDSGLGIATTVQDDRQKRFGFSFRRTGDH